MDAPAESPATQLRRSSRRYARDGNQAAEAALVSATSMTSDEPTTLAQALSRPDADEWRKAINAELENLNAKGTWKGAALPKVRRAIGAKWVSKVKRDGEGKVAKYKARLVAQGFSQQPGIDYEDPTVGRMSYYTPTSTTSS